MPGAIGALAGLMLGWALPRVMGPPIMDWAPALRDNPRVSDAVIGAGSLLVSISEAPAVYVSSHAPVPPLSDAAVAAIGWTLIGLVAGALVAAVRAVRRERSPGSLVTCGALAGLLLGWLVPALCQALGACFIHCWMHEGLLGTMALVGGGALRAVGTLAELPWRMVAGEALTAPPAAMAVSAAAWTAVGSAAAGAIHLARTRRREMGKQDEPATLSEATAGTDGA